MSKISKEGAVSVRNNVERPLKVIWEDIERAGIAEKCKDAYAHIFKFLNEVDGWEKAEVGNPALDPKVVVNGKEFTPRGE